MSLSKTWNGVTYTIPENTETGWGAQVTAFLSALADNAATTVSQKFAVRVATTTPVTVSSTTDCIIMTNLSSAGAVTVNLPVGSTGKIFGVVDQKGDAATNNITIDGDGSQTINGSATYVINANRGGVLLAWSGGEWVVISTVGTSAITGDFTVQDTAANSPIVTVKTTGSISSADQTAIFVAKDNTTSAAELGVVKKSTNSPAGYLMLNQAGYVDSRYIWWDSAAAIRVSNNVSNIGSTTSSAWNFGTGIQLPTSGGTASVLNAYEEFSATVTFSWNGTGGTSTVDATYFLRMCGKIVAIEIPQILATTRTTSTILSAPAGSIPSRFIGSSNYYLVLVRQGGTNLTTAGLLGLLSDGSILIYKDGAASAFTNTTANCGLAERTTVLVIK